MGTLFTFLIIIIAITILRFTKDSYKDYKKVAKEGGIRNKYNVLINHFIDLDPQMKIIKETNMYCYLSAQHHYACLSFRFQHTFDKINISVYINHRDLGNHKLNWVFRENMPQDDMIYHIEKRINEYMNDVTNNNQKKYHEIY